MAFMRVSGVAAYTLTIMNYERREIRNSLTWWTRVAKRREAVIEILEAFSFDSGQWVNYESTT